LQYPADAPEAKREGIPMSDFDRNYATATRGVGAGRAVAIDAGLRAYMIRVYNYMAMGVGLTGVVSWLAYQLAGGDALVITGRGIGGLTSFGQLVFSFPGQIVLALGTLGLVIFIGARIQRLQVATALGLFMLYAGLLGLLLAPIFLEYTHASITRTFFISAASFGALSLYGYTTQRSLSAMGSFLVMGMFGLIIAMLVNVFLQSPMFNFVISAAGVLIFAGLTAWDTQRIKEMYDPNQDGTVTGRMAVMGALQLYLDFINLFLFMLRFLGDRR
jgi:FtsH-binding integral membrane protein